MKILVPLTTLALTGCASLADIDHWGPPSENSYSTDAMPRSLALKLASHFCEKQHRVMHVRTEAYGTIIFRCDLPEEPKGTAAPAPAGP